MFIIYNCRTMSLLEVYHICISNSTLYTSYNLYFSANSQRKHQVQTRHFDRKSTQNATSFHLAIETVLLGVLACFSSAFLAVRRLQTDRKSGLVQKISHTALLMGFFQSAEIGVLFTEQCLRTRIGSISWSRRLPNRCRVPSGHGRGADSQSRSGPAIADSLAASRIPAAYPATGSAPCR